MLNFVIISDAKIGAINVFKYFTVSQLLMENN